MQILNPEKSKHYLTQQEMQLLELPAPSSKKYADLRTNELRRQFLGPCLEQVDFDSEDLKKGLPERHIKMLEVLKDSLGESVAVKEESD